VCWVLFRRIKISLQLETLDAQREEGGVINDKGPGTRALGVYKQYIYPPLPPTSQQARPLGTSTIPNLAWPHTVRATHAHARQLYPKATRRKSKAKGNPPCPFSRSGQK